MQVGGSELGAPIQNGEYLSLIPRREAVNFIDWLGKNSGAVIAVFALLFTVGSWWWLHARKGNLKVADVHNFSGYVNTDSLIIRLPLLFENPGARPRVVRYLRLISTARGSSGFRAEAQAFFPILAPEDPSKAEGRSDFFHAFAVPSFGVETKYVQFHAHNPPITPGESVTVELQEEVGPQNWRTLRAFELHTENLTGTFIAVSNLEDVWPDGFAEKALQYQKLLVEKRIKSTEPEQDATQRR